MARIVCDEETQDNPPAFSLLSKLLIMMLQIYHTNILRLRRNGLVAFLFIPGRLLKIVELKVSRSAYSSQLDGKRVPYQGKEVIQE